MKYILFFILLCTTSVFAFSQRPGAFIFMQGPWRSLGLRRVLFLQNNPRTPIAYGVPAWLFPTYRALLEPQIREAEILPLETPLLPTQQAELTHIETFGIQENLRHNPTGILTLIPATQQWTEFNFATANPDLGSVILRIPMRNNAIIALGVMANLHIEAAEAMREQNYTDTFIQEQLGRAHHLMGLQIAQLQMAQDEGQDVTEIMQLIFENREALGYLAPPPPPLPRPSCFWRKFFSGTHL